MRRALRTKPETILKNRVLARIGAMDDIVVMNNAQVVQREYDEEGKLERVAQGGLGDGSADLIVCLGPRGRFVGLELKTRHTDPEVAARQAAWARSIRAMGGFVAECWSVDEALAAIERARRGENA